MIRHGLFTCLLAMGISVSGCADMPTNPQDSLPGSGGNTTETTGGSSLVPETPADAKLTQAFFDKDRALKAQPSMVEYRYQHTSLVIGKYVYHFGGYDSVNGKVLDSIERSEIQADSSLGAFESVEAKLDVARHGHSAERIGEYVYVFGSTLAADDKKVARAKIDTNGNLGSFEDVGVTLDQPRGQHASAVIGDHIYLFGGSKANQSKTVSKAPIQEDGSLGDFVDAGISIDVGRQLSTLAVVEENVYLLGGAVSGQNVTVSRATIGTGSVLSNFEKVDATIDKGRHFHSQIVLGRQIHLIGGTGGSTSVSTTIVQPDGTLGAFKPKSEANYEFKLNSPGHAGHTSLVIGKRAYVFGGNQEKSGKRVLVGFLD